jgi:dTMP kinase
MAFLAGITLLGREVGDEVRGRVFAFIQTAVRVTLIGTISVAGSVVGVGSSRRLKLGSIQVDVSTSRVLLFVAGVAGITLGYLSLRQIDDDVGRPVLSDVWRSIGRRGPPGGSAAAGGEHP